MLPVITQPVDYLVVGHLACDLVATGTQTGGTVAYSALTARALGLKTAVVTAWAGELPDGLFNGIQVVCLPSPHSTTFENKYNETGRVQFLHQLADGIKFEAVPPAWRKSKIVHIGPIAQELEIGLSVDLHASFLGITPQGWMRKWDNQGLITHGEWKEADRLMPLAAAVVISQEDVDGNEDVIQHMAQACRVLAVTDGPAGSRCFWHNDQRRFNAPVLKEVDATGAGDIYATAFFYRLQTTRNPWEAARFATRLAAFSVRRPGLEAIPTPQEVKTCLVEVI